MVMRILLALILCASFAGVAIGQDNWFSDDFEDGIIDPQYWDVNGDITESGGFLNLDREDPADWVKTVSDYSGDWVIEVDIRLNYIVLNDMLHGIAIGPENGPSSVGIIFGYSMYGKLFIAQRWGNGITTFSYGPDGSNKPGTWLHWKFEKTGGSITIEVDGQPVPGIGTANIAEGSYVYLPGLYEDGDGLPHVGFTSSTVDNFSITESGMALEISTWGELKTLYYGN
ncbi:MAG: hypothetical protein GQ565_00840 [Candidatus Aegiribacteria sp.]|nr:hypothetical protein [Candidatus Aegiribacteria sp.]